MKCVKHLLTILFLGFSASLWSQAATAAPEVAEKTGQFAQIMTYVLALAGFVLFVAAMIVVVKVNQFLYKRVLSLEAAKAGVALPEMEAEIAKVAGDSFWDKLRKKYWEGAVPMEREHEILSHHEYDGIRELDNSLPPWWVNLFILTVIWAVFYMYYYHWGGNGPSSEQEYKTEIAEAEKQQAVALAGLANAIDESNVSALTESGPLGEGELIFKGVCAACHGQAGEGTVGPNLTDEYWLHGGGIHNIFKTIKYGVPEKGMISWQSQLTPSDMQKVASYILTLGGTNPPNPKAPQGEIWVEPAPADSSATQEATPPSGN